MNRNKEKFFVVIGKRNLDGTIIKLVELPIPDTGYAIIDYVKERAYSNALPKETIQQKVDKEAALNDPKNIRARINEIVLEGKVKER